MFISYLTKWKDKCSTLTVIVIGFRSDGETDRCPDCIMVPISFTACPHGHRGNIARASPSWHLTGVARRFPQHGLALGGY